MFLKQWVASEVILVMDAVSGMTARPPPLEPGMFTEVGHHGNQKCGAVDRYVFSR